MIQAHSVSSMIDNVATCSGQRARTQCCGLLEYAVKTRGNGEKEKQFESARKGVKPRLEPGQRFLAIIHFHTGPTRANNSIQDVGCVNEALWFFFTINQCQTSATHELD